MINKKIISLFTALILSYPIISAAETTAAPFGSKEQATTEAHLLGALSTLNHNEIAAGNLAEKKSSNAKVKHFAAFMIKEHTKNLNKTKRISSKLGIQPSDGKVALQLKHKGKKELASLKRLNGASFDKGYMNAMVKGHESALKLVDGLIQQSSNPSIKQYLLMTKSHIAHHLEKAQLVQASLK